MVTKLAEYERRLTRLSETEEYRDLVDSIPGLTSRGLYFDELGTRAIPYLQLDDPEDPERIVLGELTEDGLEETELSGEQLSLMLGGAGDVEKREDLVETYGPHAYNLI